MTLERKIAKNLLEIEAVALRPNDYFTWTSGIKSPIYCDNRITMSYPKIRREIAAGLSEVIKKNFPEVEVVAGTATAGIPHAAWVSEKLNKPMIYVRSKPKDHGAGRQTEGAVTTGKKVVLIDDLISTGGSVLAAVEAIRKEGANVLGVVSIFSYELSEGLTNFTNAKLTFKSLTTYSQLVATAIERGELNKSQLKTLQNWQQNPNKWQL